jgi:hypothetical protein
MTNAKENGTTVEEKETWVILANTNHHNQPAGLGSGFRASDECMGIRLNK